MTRFVFQVKAIMALADITLNTSTDARKILNCAKRLAKNLSKDEFQVSRGMPFHQGRSDEELRAYLAKSGPSKILVVAVYDNVSGDQLGEFDVKPHSRLSALLRFAKKYSVRK